MSFGISISRFLACLCLLAVFASPGLKADTLLFESHATLEIAIPLDFRMLCRPREAEDCDYTPTTLDFVDEHGESRSLPIEVIIRGGWRSLTKNCSAPLLFIRFDDASTAGTPFAGQTLLPLTTHCGQGLSVEATRVRKHQSDWEQYLLKEYLAHRLYNVVTRVSLNARLVQITYPNPHKPGRKITNYAFFTEHFRSVAARNDSELLDRGSFDAEKIDLEAAGRAALFQYMIGNTDWSILRERNTVLLMDSNATQVPLPFDFDMSGLVDAEYAGPAPNLPIDDVRERYYLGFCAPAGVMDSLFERYLARREEFLDLLQETPGLNKKSTRSTRRYLNRFFEILESEELRERKIVNHCQPVSAL